MLYRTHSLEALLAGWDGIETVAFVGLSVREATVKLILDPSHTTFAGHTKSLSTSFPQAFPWKRKGFIHII
jgi:hypothetical protein